MPRLDGVESAIIAATPAMSHFSVDPRLHRSNLPRFIERGGEQVVRGPFFLLRGRREALARVCAQTIEAPSGGEVRCRPLGDLVLLNIAAIGRITSLDPRDREFGWMPEQDVGFWIPVELEYVEHGQPRRRSAWLIPYLFIDSGSRRRCCRRSKAPTSSRATPGRTPPAG